MLKKVVKRVTGLPTAKLPSSATAHQMEGVDFMILSGRYIGYLPASYAAKWAARWVAIDRMRSLLPERFRLITSIETVTRKGPALSLVSQAFLDLMRGRCGELG